MLNRRGLTLLESAIALVIFGLIVAAVWIVFARVNANNNLNRTERGMVTTAANIREFYRDRIITSGDLNNARAIDLGLISPELMIGGTPIHHLGSGGAADLVIGSSSAVCGPTTNLFFMRLDDISQNGCNQLTARLMGTSGKINENGIFSASINGASVLAGTTFDINTALNNCSNDSVTVLVCFRKD